MTPLGPLLVPLLAGQDQAAAMIRESVATRVSLQGESGAWTDGGVDRISGEIPAAYRVGGTATGASSKGPYSRIFPEKGSDSSVGPPSGALLRSQQSWDSKVKRSRSTRSMSHAPGGCTAMTFPQRAMR